MKNKIIILFMLALLIFTSFSYVSGENIFSNDVYRQNLALNTPEILWWYDLDAPSFGSAAVGDIDGDSKPEIVFGTYFNDEHIYALNAESGTLHWKYNTGGCNDASPTIADVDLDSELEVIVPASSPYRIYCFNGETGNVEWSTSTGYPNCIDSPPAVADVDNDDKPEIIFGTFYGYVFCLNGEDGSIFWQVNLGTDSYIQSGPNILDLDLDGQLDIVVAQYSGDCRIYALKGDDGSTLWYSDLPEDYMYHGGSFADIDEDGKPEIAIGSYDNQVYILNGEDGSLLWSYSAPFYIAAPTSIADLNNDGHLEIIFAYYNTIGVLSHTGSLLWSYPTGGSIFRGVSIADVNGDNNLDVAFGSSDGKLRVLKGDDGQVVWIYNLQAHYGDTYNIDHAPVIFDFDGDGALDIFVVGGYGTSSPPTDNHGRAYALSAGEGTGPGWPKFRYDLNNSAHFHSNQAPNAPIINGPSEGVVGNNYEFLFVATDPEEDDVYYWIDWGDGLAEEWIGPFFSGEEVNIVHNWSSSGLYEIKAKTKDIFDKEGDWSEIFLMSISENNAPSIPEIDGATKGNVGIFYTYTFTSIDPEENDISYFIKWGDGSTTGWTTPKASGTPCYEGHIWDDEGKFFIEAKAKDINGEEGEWGKRGVTIPRNRASVSSYWLKFIDMFSILRILLQRLR